MRMTISEKRIGEIVRETIGNLISETMSTSDIVHYEGGIIASEILKRIRNGQYKLYKNVMWGNFDIDTIQISFDDSIFKKENGINGKWKDDIFKYTTGVDCFIGLFSQEQSQYAKDFVLYRNYNGEIFLQLVLVNGKLFGPSLSDIIRHEMSHGLTRYVTNTTGPTKPYEYATNVLQTQVKQDLNYKISATIYYFTEEEVSAKLQELRSELENNKLEDCKIYNDYKIVIGFYNEIKNKYTRDEVSEVLKNFHMGYDNYMLMTEKRIKKYKYRLGKVVAAHNQGIYKAKNIETAEKYKNIKWL